MSMAYGPETADDRNRASDTNAIEATESQLYTMKMSGRWIRALARLRAAGNVMFRRWGDDGYVRYVAEGSGRH